MRINKNIKYYRNNTEYVEEIAFTYMFGILNKINREIMI